MATKTAAKAKTAKTVKAPKAPKTTKAKKKPAAKPNRTKKTAVVTDHRGLPADVDIKGHEPVQVVIDDVVSVETPSQVPEPAPVQEPVTEAVLLDQEPGQSHVTIPVTGGGEQTMRSALTAIKTAIGPGVDKTVFISGNPKPVTASVVASRARGVARTFAEKKASELVRFLRIHAKTPYAKRGQQAILRLSKEVAEAAQKEQKSFDDVVAETSREFVAEQLLAIEVSQ